MMAEKPRLKKSNEILGSIAASPPRAARGGDAARSIAPGSGQRDHRQSPEPEPREPDFDGEDIELSDQPVLPSAQSLAEKLLAREDKRKQLNFSRYELPKRGGAVTSQAQAQAPGKPAGPVPAATPEQSPEPSPVSQAAEFELTPEPRQPLRPVSGSVQESVPEPAQGSELTPEPRQPSSPAPQAAMAFESGRKSAPVITEYTFQSFEEQEDASVREFSVGRGGDSPEPGRGLRERQRRARTQMNNPRNEPAAESDSGFDFDPQPESETKPRTAPKLEPGSEPRQEPMPEPRQPLRNGPKPRQESEPRPVPPPQATPQAADPETAAERSRQEFLNRISDQFKLQFEEKFEEGTVTPRDTVRRSMRLDPPPNIASSAPQPELRDAPISEPRQPLGTAPGSVQESEPSPLHRPQGAQEDDFLSYVQRQERAQRTTGQPDPPSLRAADGDDAPALEFIEKFRLDVHEEEQRRSEDFKETLAEKFERERERYLKELEISQTEPEGPPAPSVSSAGPTRRRLDFQIQPEMHMSGGEQPPAPRREPKPAEAAGPVTYTRGGTARPQAPVDPEPSQTPGAQNAASKKTGEQLLMEHGARTRARAQTPKPQPADLKFTFSTPEEQDENQKKKKREPILPAEKWPRRIVLLSMAASLLAICLLIWPLISQMQLSDRLKEQSEAPDAETAPAMEDTLNVYNDLIYSQTAKVNNVVFKNAGVTLKNVDVNDYVIIDSIESGGKIRLEDINVNTAVSVKSCDVDTLELHNVKAGRVIVNNAKTDMTVSATGSTDVGVLELRTPATVRLSEPTGEAVGIRGMVIAPAEAGNSINAKLSGLSLQTLETSASESILTFENDTRAETMSSDGSLSLSGSGKVMTLSVGAKTGLGAGDLEDRKDVTVFVKDVAITNLNVKSSANLNLTTTVDHVSTSDPVFIGGDGNIGSMTLNPRTGLGRLLVDIVGVNIQSLYSNTQSRINITGSARVNVLTADASTYTLGNKVNHLIVKSDGVIYENEPDKITVSEGVRPPQTKAENPNLDYNLGEPTVTDATEGDFATTCGHSRESGGFLLGDGSVNAPYEVSAPAQLSHISSHLDSHFIQTADIDISGDSRYAGGFAMIGSASSPFTGVYDGIGFAISSLRVISSEENVGLFAWNRGTIRNVSIVSGEISSGATGLSYIGGIAGLNSDGGSIRSCSNGAAINGNQNTYTGGIAGYNFGAKIHDCFNYAKVSGVDVVGGLVGFNRRSAALTGSYNAGSVNGRDDVGSVAGINEDATIANCYYLTGTADDGVGSGGGTATEKDSGELSSPQMAADLAAGNESSLWVSGNASANYRYPTLRKP